MDQVSRTREERAKALEDWADRVDPAELRLADTEVLRKIAALAQRRSEVEDDLTAAVLSARRAQRTWSEIGSDARRFQAGRSKKVRVEDISVTQDPNRATDSGCDSDLTLTTISNYRLGTNHLAAPLGYRPAGMVGSESDQVGYELSNLLQRDRSDVRTRPAPRRGRR